jgi:hypothetical protein
MCGTSYSNAATLAIGTPLTITVDGQGSVSLDPPGGVYAPGTAVSLVPTPATGWRFSHWAGGVQGSSVPAQVTMTEGLAVTAVFERLQHTLTTNMLGKGSIEQTPSKTLYDYGEEVLLDAQPETGWRFITWAGDASGPDSSITVLMDRDRKVTAIFAQAVATLPASSTTPSNQGSSAGAGGLCGLGAGITTTLLLIVFVPARMRRRRPARSR